MFTQIKDGGITAPLGFRAAAVCGDVKGKGGTKNDMALVVSDSPCTAAALFTENVVKAAPVIYDSAILNANSTNISAILANSGNANACTGTQGLEVCKALSEETAKLLNVSCQSVLAASTGVIGNPMPVDRMAAKLPELVQELSDDGGSDFSTAIMTTDTVSKEIAVLVETDKGCFVIGGCCKGAGMIAPSLATMLAFITTDAKIPANLLQKALKEAVAGSFNCVSVDGDMSTNDSVFVLANGMSGVSVSEKEYEIFVKALSYVCLDLAKKIAIDGEGATKSVTVRVKGAANNDEARLCAYKIANSPLVKTMFAGCDPNWGRLMASAGASGAKFDPNKTDIFFNNLHYVKNGIIIDTALEKDVYEIMQ
ncbi:MAG: bifunctional glutamate N-acetyltransferase/amino-acid acetyltransferase ArgJ, partial [Deferribacterales bacterium]|nr:bifunctional glutamate N-acetyltransferase/amino-acid acetyltransferase ArgJ [Deferribacterales bacterium]